MSASSIASSVYIHFPWCLKKCPYCDFASYANEKHNIDHEGYRDLVLKELEHWKQSPFFQEPRELVSIFFGGGTPSLWKGSCFKDVIQAIRHAFNSHHELEITAECNPSSLDLDQAKAMFDAGINRFSVGVQSLQPQTLAYLGRLHDGPTALRSIEAALTLTSRVSGDLIFGSPTDTKDAVLTDAKDLLNTGIDHLSAYSLTIESGTQFGELHKKGKLKVASEEDVIETYLGIESLAASKGFLHYEVSNYAKPGSHSVHNAHYWKRGDYLGLGCGAVGCLRSAQHPHGFRYKNQNTPASYGSQTTWLEQESLSKDQSLIETLMLGLRTKHGVPLSHLHEQFGINEKTHRGLIKHASMGHLIISDSISISPKHWLMLDGIVADLI